MNAFGFRNIAANDAHALAGKESAEDALPITTGDSA